jgi:hypothetical protein
MSQNLNSVPLFNGTNYGYWKARMRLFFLKSIDFWKIVETGWIKLEETVEITVIQTSARLSNDKALHALCQVLSLSEFARISNCEIAKDAWQILETTYEGTKLVKSARLQMLISKFEEIKMLEEETFGEFYTKISDLRNSMVSLGNQISDVKLIRNILRSLLERFRIKVTTIEESKDLEEMKIEELVGSLSTYEYSLPLVRKVKTISLKASKLLVLCWLHSVGQNHFLVMMLFNRDSTIQKCFQKIMYSLQGRKFGSLPVVRTTRYSVRTLICQSIIRSDDENFPSGRPSVSRSFKQFKVASVRT